MGVGMSGQLTPTKRCKLLSPCLPAPSSSPTAGPAATGPSTRWRPTRWRSRWARTSSSRTWSHAGRRADRPARERDLGDDGHGRSSRIRRSAATKKIDGGGGRLVHRRLHPRRDQDLRARERLKIRDQRIQRPVRGADLRGNPRTGPAAERRRLSGDQASVYFRSIGLPLEEPLVAALAVEAGKRPSTFSRSRPGNLKNS